MSTRYAYSYNREDYTGSYATPEEAFAAGLARSDAPTDIFVGAVVEADPQAHDHAESVLHSMSQRAFVDYGNSARGYLRSVPCHLVKELDQDLGAVILRWLERNNLKPTFVRIGGSREFTTQPSGACAHFADVVHDIGTVESLPVEDAARMLGLF